MATTKSSYDDIRKRGVGGVRGSDLYGEPETFAQKMQRFSQYASKRNYEAAHGHIGYGELQNPDLYEYRVNPPGTELGDLGTSRYDSFVINALPGDVQDQRAYNQPWWSKALDGTLKGFTTAGTTFIDGTIGLLNGLVQGIYNVSTGEGTFGQGFFDNATSNAMRQFTDYMEEVLPNYRSQDEMENPWALRNIFSVNTIFDDFVKNLGFTVGAFYSGDAWLQALRFMRVTGKMGQLGSQVLGSVLSGFNEGRIEAGHVYDDMMKTEMKNLEVKYKELFDEINARPDEMVQTAEGQYVSSKELALEKLQQNLKREKEDIKNRAAAAASMDMVMNSLYLPLDNAYTFGKLYGRGFKIKSDLANRIKRNGLTWETVVNKGIVKGLGIGAVEGFEEMNQRLMSEFSTRYYSPDSPDEYYKALVNSDHQVQTKEFMTALTESLKSSYGDPNGWKEFAIGALTGLIGMPTFGKANNSANNTYVGNGKFIGLSGGLAGSIREARILNNQANDLVTQMNDYMQSKLNNQSQFLTRARGFKEAIDGFSAENDEFEFNNASDNDLFNMIDVFGRAGQLDFLKDQLNIQFDNIADQDLEGILKDTSTDQNDWTNPDGTPMSSTEQGRAKMRAKLNEHRDEILNAINKYEESLEVVRGIGRGALDDDQTRELAWYDWKTKQFVDRFLSIKDKNTNEETPYDLVRNKLQSLLDAVSVFNRGRGQGMLSDDEEGNKKKTEMLIVQGFLEALMNSKSIYQVSGHLQGNKDIVNYINNMAYPMLSDMVDMSEQEFEKLQHDLSDMARIAIAAGQFQKRYSEFTKHPEELIQNRKRIDAEEAKKNEIRQNDQQVNNLRNKSVNDLANIDGLYDMLSQVEGSQLSQEDKTKLEQAAKVQRDMQIMMDAANQILKNMLDNHQITQEQYDAMKDDVSQVLSFVRKNFNDPKDITNTETEAYLRAFEDDMGIISDEDQARLDLANQLIKQAIQNTEDQRAAAMVSPFSDEIQSMVDQQEQDGPEGSKGGDTHMSQSQLEAAQKMQEELEKKERQEKQDKAFMNSLQLNVAAEKLFGDDLTTLPQEQKDMLLQGQVLGMQKMAENLAKDLRKRYYDKSLEGKTVDEKVNAIMSTINTSQVYNDLSYLLNQNKKGADSNSWLNGKIMDFLKRLDQDPVSQQDEMKKFERGADDQVTVYLNDGGVQDDQQSASLGASVLRFNTSQYAIYSDRMIPYWQIEFENNNNVETVAIKVHRAIHTFLLDKNAFGNVKRLGTGTNLLYGMSKALNDEISKITGQTSYVVLILDEAGNVYGDLVSPFDTDNFNYRNENGQLGRIYADVTQQYEQSISDNPNQDIVKTTITTKAWQPMFGKIPYQYDSQHKDVRITLNEWNPGFQMALVVNSSNPEMHNGTKTMGKNEVRYPKVLHLGKPYVLIDGAGGKKVAVSIQMPKLNYDSQQNTYLVQALQHAIAAAIAGNLGALEAKVRVLDLLALEGFYVKVLTNDDNQRVVEFQAKKDGKWRKIASTTIKNNDDQGAKIDPVKRNEEAMRQAALVIKEIQSVYNGDVTFQISKRLINKNYDKLPSVVPYNEMIGQLATVNLPKGLTATINDWFTLEDYDGKRTPILFSSWETKPDQHNITINVNGIDTAVIVDTTMGYMMLDQTTKKRIDLDSEGHELRWAEQIKARIWLNDNGITVTGSGRDTHVTPWGKYDLAKDKFVGEDSNVLFKVTNIPKAPDEVDDREVIVTDSSIPIGRKSFGFAKGFPSREVLGVDANGNVQSHWMANGNYIIYVKSTPSIFNRDDKYSTIIINRQPVDFNKLVKLTKYLEETPHNEIDTNEVLRLFQEDMNIQPGDDQNILGPAGAQEAKELVEKFNNTFLKGKAQIDKFENVDEKTKAILRNLFKLGYSQSVRAILNNLVYTRNFTAASEKDKIVKINAKIKPAGLRIDDDGNIVKIQSGKAMQATGKARMKMNTRREMRWMSRALPQLQANDRIVLVNSLQELAKKADGMKVYGYFKNGIIYLSTESIQGASYHESFHYVFDTLLSTAEKNMAYNEARQKYGDLSSVQLEERMAESFRRYMLWEEMPVIGSLARLWHKLKRFVNSLFGKDVYLNRLFHEINNGKYAQIEERQQEEPQYDEITPQSIRQYHTQKKTWMALDAEDREFLDNNEVDPELWRDTPEEVKDNILHCR